MFSALHHALQAYELGEYVTLPDFNFLNWGSEHRVTGLDRLPVKANRLSSYVYTVDAAVAAIRNKHSKGFRPCSERGGK